MFKLLKARLPEDLCHDKFLASPTGTHMALFQPGDPTFQQHLDELLVSFPELGNGTCTRDEAKAFTAGVDVPKIHTLMRLVAAYTQSEVTADRGEYAKRFWHACSHGMRPILAEVAHAHDQKSERALPTGLYDAAVPINLLYNHRRWTWNRMAISRSNGKVDADVVERYVINSWSKDDTDEKKDMGNFLVNVCAEAMVKNGTISSLCAMGNGMGPEYHSQWYLDNLHGRTDTQDTVMAWLDRTPEDSYYDVCGAFACVLEVAVALRSSP